MVWVLAFVAVLVLYLIYISRPDRMIRSTIVLAERTCRKMDWQDAAKSYRVAHAVAGRLKEPVKSQVESQIEIQWAGVLYRQGQMGEAEDLLRRGLVKARCHLSPESGFLMQGELYWGDLCTDMGRHGEAEQHYRKAHEGDEQRGNLAGVVFALQKLGDSLICQERRGDAESEIRRAIDIETRVVHEQLRRDGKDPAEHPIISMNQPDLYFCREQYEDARPLYRAKVEYWAGQAARPANIDLGRLQMRLAIAEAQTGHLADAIEMYGRAEATFRREWCDEHPRTVAAREAKAALSREIERAG
jgi:tetratricopeptide (TPR) repeat protein